MAVLKPQPLLTRDALPLEAIAEICRRWGVREMAIDSSRTPPGTGAAVSAGGQPLRVG